MARKESPQLNIDGISTSTTQGASLIPQYIGLTLPVPPNKIYLTEENKKTILLNNPSLPAEITLDRNGRYFPKYNTFFAQETGDPTLDLYVDIHESFHALTHQLNPDFSKMYDTVDVEGWIKSRDTAAFSNLLIMSYLDEGIARYGTYEILRALRAQDFKNAADQSEFHLDQIFGTQTPADQRPLNVLRELPKRFADSFSTHVLCLDYYSQQDFMAQWQSFNNNKYFVGHLFTHDTLYHLQANGFSLAQGLTHVITNPPASLNEFSDNQAYCNRLLNE